MIRKLALAVATCSAMVAAMPAAAATQIVVDGKLTGASGVTVGSRTYDVTFVEGTCEQVYGSCSTSSFNFQTEADARSAAQALLDQVFLDTAQGRFDSDPSLTFGCSNPSACFAIIPYTGDPSYRAILAINESSSSNRVGTNSDTRDQNSGDNGIIVWTRFDAVTSPGGVPEPATWALMILGFGAVGSAMRRQKTRTAVRFA